MIEIPGLLLVSGTGRNSGKTTFVCTLIEKYKHRQNITAIKIAPHAHMLSPEDEILVRNEHFQVVRETKTNTGKDSSLMLQAGATEVFYVQATDEYLPDAYQELAPYLQSGNLTICESGGLRNFIKPDLFLIIHNSDNSLIKPSANKLIPLADKLICRNGDQWDFDIEKIIVEKNRWFIR